MRLVAMPRIVDHCGYICHRSSTPPFLGCEDVEIGVDVISDTTDCEFTFRIDFLHNQLHGP